MNPVVAVRVKGVSKRFVSGRTEPLSVLLPSRLVRRHRAPTPRKEVWALRDVSFKVARGTVLGVIGANGAGKSTLLKVLAMITRPTTGRAEVRGRVIPLMELGGAFQPDSTGRENVYLNAAMYGIPRQVAARRMDEIARFAGVEDFLDTPVKRYSSGMYVRLAFSVAVNMEPDLLLADEILAVGDQEFQEQCLRRVDQAAADGLTVLFVSHDMAAIRRMCSRVIWLNAGRVVMDGPAEEVVRAYEDEFWAMFAGAEQEGEHSNEFGQIISTQLLTSDGNQIGAGRVTDELLVRTTVRMHRPGVGFRTLLLFATERADAFRCVQPEVVSVDEPGTYTADVRLPRHFFNDVTYTIKVGIWLTLDGRESKRKALIRRNALSFRLYDVVDDSDGARGTFKGRLGGVLRPKFDWQVARSREIAHDLGAAALAKRA